MGGQAISDIASGDRFKWQNYAGAAARGTVAGGLFFTTLDPAAAGAAGAAVQNTTARLLIWRPVNSRTLVRLRWLSKQELGR